MIASPSPDLPRALGVGSATLLVVGGIIGSGIFFTPAEVARALPSGGWVLVVWAAGGLVALAGALTYAELLQRRETIKRRLGESGGSSGKRPRLRRR